MGATCATGHMLFFWSSKEWVQGQSKSATACHFLACPLVRVFFWLCRARERKVDVDIAAERGSDDGQDGWQQQGGAAAPAGQRQPRQSQAGRQGQCGLDRAAAKVRGTWVSQDGLALPRPGAVPVHVGRRHPASGQNKKDLPSHFLTLTLHIPKSYLHGVLGRELSSALHLPGRQPAPWATGCTPVPRRLSPSAPAPAGVPAWKRYDRVKSLGRQAEATLEMVYSRTQWPSDDVIDSMWDLHRLRKDKVRCLCDGGCVDGSRGGLLSVCAARRPGPAGVLVHGSKDSTG